jgi:hypothetical protein
MMQIRTNHQNANAPEKPSRFSPREFPATIIQTSSKICSGAAQKSIHARCWPRQIPLHDAGRHITFQICKVFKAINSPRRSEHRLKEGQLGRLRNTGRRVSRLLTFLSKINERVQSMREGRGCNAVGVGNDLAVGFLHVRLIPTSTSNVAFWPSDTSYR